MSTFTFSPATGPIRVRAEVTGPAGTGVLRLILDTGATKSLIDTSSLLSLGFDPSLSTLRATVLTGGSAHVVPLVVVTRFSALGQHRFGLPVVAHSLPASALADGLLGLDFLQNQVLTIDFRAGQITLA
jgi:aspartyl protease family protein